jgi:hypothetical protein
VGHVSGGYSKHFSFFQKQTIKKGGSTFLGSISTLTYTKPGNPLPSILERFDKIMSSLKASMLLAGPRAI